MLEKDQSATAEDQENGSAARFPRRTARRQQTRARILEAAQSEFQRVGYSDATMNAIADHADVHVTTLFTHFKQKRDLAQALADDELEKLAELIAEAKGQRPFFAFFRDLVLTTAGLRQREGDPKRGINRESLLEPELALHWIRYEEREIELLADYIAADYGIGDADDYTPHLAADVLISSGVMVYSRWRKARGALDLVKETMAALDLAERMALAILPQGRAPIAAPQAKTPAPKPRSWKRPA